MNDHDITEVWQYPEGSWCVRCMCGGSWTRERKQDALDAHMGHYGVMKARAELRTDKGDD